MIEKSDGLVIVVSSPSGCGKGTILKKLLKEDDNLRFSISATTRKPRPGEVDGKDYCFISRDEFVDNINDGKMLEYTEYCGNFYGTPAGPLKKMTEEGYDAVLEIEVQGGLFVKKNMPDCVSIFIVPPSMEVLEQRLRNRGTEDDETIKKRLNQAREEIPVAADYDYIVINDVVDDAVNVIKSIILAEKSKRLKNTDLIENLLGEVK